MTHRKLSEAMIKAARKVLNDYTLDDVLDAVENYNEVLGDNNYYFNTVWGLDTFLKQQNAFPHFTNDGEKWLAYLASKKPVRKKVSYHTKADEKVDIDTSDRRRK